MKPNVTKKWTVGKNGWHEIYNILKELYITSFKWEGLPESINQRFMELSLFDYGKVVFFKDDFLGHLALKATQIGPLNVYYEPTKIRAFGGNGYQAVRDNFKDCVIIYNNFIRDTPQIRILEYAKRIHDLERTIDINVHAQRTPVLIKTSKKQELTVRNILMQYEEYKPFIVVDEEMGGGVLDAINTHAEFVARDLMDLKKQIWNEALSYIGIENNSAEKNERLTANEVMVSNGLAVASRNAKLQAREEAVDKINKMFGLNISVDINNESVFESPLDDKGGSDDE